MIKLCTEDRGLFQERPMVISAPFLSFTLVDIPPSTARMSPNTASTETCLTKHPSGSHGRDFLVS